MLCPPTVHAYDWLRIVDSPARVGLGGRGAHTNLVRLSPSKQMPGQVSHQRARLREKGPKYTLACKDAAALDILCAQERLTPPGCAEDLPTPGTVGAHRSGLDRGLREHAIVEQHRNFVGIEEASIIINILQWTGDQPCVEVQRSRSRLVVARPPPLCVGVARRFLRSPVCGCLISQES